MLKVFGDGDDVFSAADGAKIFSHRLGTGPIALIFMHGWGGSGSYWDALVRHIDPEGLSLFMVDLRGHHRSEHTRNGFTTSRFAEDIIELSDHLQLKKPILVGYSMSARWAQWICCTCPDLAAGQILIAPIPAVALSFPPQMAGEWIQRVRTREGFHAFERQFLNHPVDPEILDDCFDAIERVPDHTLQETLKMCTEEGFIDKLGAIRAPTIVISGTADPMGTPAYVRTEVAHRIPGARLALLPCGHNVPLEMPAETAAIIQGFLAGLGDMAGA
jgi:pimeloyl-ACP methyl ester carboxylesterase